MTQFFEHQINLSDKSTNYRILAAISPNIAAIFATSEQSSGIRPDLSSSSFTNILIWPSEIFRKSGSVPPD